MTFYPTFDVFGSISVVVYAVIGGVGAALGAVVGAGLAPGTVGAYLVSHFGSDLDDLFRLFGGLLLIVVLLQDSDGLVSLYRKLVLRLARRPVAASRRCYRSCRTAVRARPAPATLELRAADGALRRRDRTRRVSRSA